MNPNDEIEGIDIIASNELPSPEQKKAEDIIIPKIETPIIQEIKQNVKEDIAKAEIKMDTPTIQEKEIKEEVTPVKPQKDEVPLPVQEQDMSKKFKEEEKAIKAEVKARIEKAKEDYAAAIINLENKSKAWKEEEKVRSFTSLKINFRKLADKVAFKETKLEKKLEDLEGKKDITEAKEILERAKQEMIEAEEIANRSNNKAVFATARRVINDAKKLINDSMKAIKDFPKKTVAPEKKEAPTIATAPVVPAQPIEAKATEVPDSPTPVSQATNEGVVDLDEPTLDLQPETIDIKPIEE